MRFLIVITFQIFLLNAVLAGQSPATDQADSNVLKFQKLGLSEKCELEPVFNGKACVYEINTEAEETVVLVHGLNSHAAGWYEQIKVLKDKYHVVSFDLPGFGKSSRQNKLYSPTNFAKFVHHVVKKYVDRPFYLIGHSMGGAISLRYSAMHPEYVKRLILADVGGVLHEYAFAKSVAFKWVNWLKKVSYATIPGLENIPGMHEIANMVFQNLEWLPVNIRDALRIPELRNIILNGNSIPIAGAAVSTEDFSGTIRNNKIPTLIIWGAYDLITPIRTGRILETRMPNAYLEVLSRSAHSTMSDQPTEFNNLVLAHLNEDDDDLEEKYWQFSEFEKSERVGVCENELEKIFEGNYLRIELTNCKRVIIRNANIGSLVSKNSNVEIEKSQFVTKDIAMVLFDSTLYATGVNITAGIAAQTVHSHVDFAGVDFRVDDMTINNLGNSNAVFSVSTVNGANLHAYQDLTLAKRY